MNTSRLTVLAACFCASALSYASDPTPANHPEKRYPQFSVEAEAGAFFPLDSNMRHIYGTALPIFTLAGNWWFHKSWDLWLDVSYVFGNGHATGVGDESTHLSYIPLSIGIKYFYPVTKSTDIYVGVGPSYGFMHTVDRSEHVHRKTSANNFGATAKSGVIYSFNKRWYLQGFFNYMYQKMYFHQTESEPFVYRYSANLSSLQLGGGVGLKF